MIINNRYPVDPNVIFEEIIFYIFSNEKSAGQVI